MNGLIFICIFITAVVYTQSAKALLGMQGLYDSLTIFSLVLSAFILSVIAEIVQSVYLRAFSSLLTTLMVILSFRFILRDLPKLSSAQLSIAIIAFVLAASLAFTLFLITVIRLIMDKVRFRRLTEPLPEGEQVVPESTTEVSLAEVGKTSPVPETCPFCGEVKEPVTGRCACSDFGPAPSAQPPVAAATTKVSRLAALEGPYAGTFFDLVSGENRVGRNEGTILLPEDKQVSRKHCVIHVEESGSSILDQGSTNGVFVNNERVQQAQIKTGDLVRLGSSLFRVE